MEKHSTALFERLSDDKKRVILDASAAEFAKSGFTAAKVDTIAAQAGISVGALYKYFSNKEHCFMAVLEDGMHELEVALDQIMNSQSAPWSRIEAIVRLIPQHSRKHAAIVRLYHEIGGEGLSAISEEFCRRFEGLSAQCYSLLLSQAREAGLMRSDLDEKYAAFCLDNIFVSLQFSYACGYHVLRKEVYLGDRVEGNDEELVAQTLKFLRYGLSGK